MIERISIALEQVKAFTTSENLLNEIRKNFYSLYRAKKSLKSIFYMNTNIWIKWIPMFTVFMKIVKLLI